VSPLYDNAFLLSALSNLKPPSAASVFILIPFSTDLWYSGFFSALSLNGFMSVLEIPPEDDSSPKRNLIYSAQFGELKGDLPK